MDNASQEIRWVLRAQAGDREALEALLKAVTRPLYGYLVRLLGDASQAEDVLQEVLLRIYRKLRWVERPELFRPWAYRIATREGWKHLGRERRWSARSEDASALAELAAVEPESLDADLARELPRLVSAVSPASRAVLVLHYLEELTLPEVAAVLGASLGTVKSRLAYGLATLRRLLADQERRA